MHNGEDFYLIRKIAKEKIEFLTLYHARTNQRIELNELEEMDSYKRVKYKWHPLHKYPLE